MPSSPEKKGKIDLVKVPLETDQGIIESEERKWGMPLKEVYKHGLAFYKDKDGKAVHLSYEDRLKLVAYTQQTVHGPLDVNSASPLGVLDVIGRDRRAAWQELGNISQIQAMAGFIHTLDRLCPLFKPFIEAIQKDLEDKQQQQLRKAAGERAHMELQERVLAEKENQRSNKLTEEQQVQRIKDALNAQTYDQFLQYAQQQYPGNFDQQAVLIRQLQDQHYQQYIQQLAVDQRLANSNIQDNSIPSEKANDTEKDCNLNETAVEDNNKSMQTFKESDDVIDDVTGDITADEAKEEDSDDDGFPPIEEARMWTRKDLVQFKECVKIRGGKLSVGQGETVTLRVPTNAKAKTIIWEFATDHYDIGFGLFFEWSKSTSTEVTIHVSESDDEDDGDDDVYGDDEYVQADPEIGPNERENSALTTLKPPVSIVVPIFRRDCHKEVYSGSHTYPGEGVYLLKFDNTYSLWRSKTVYYEIYYSHPAKKKRIK